LTDSLPRPDFSRLGPTPGSKVVIAGGCGGIGSALVKSCVENGLRVAVLDLPQSLERHPPPSAALPIAMNGTDEQSVTSAFRQIQAQWTHIDHLCFLIGFTLVPPAELAQVTLAQWEDIMSGNLRSAFLVTRAAVPLLRERGGTIVTVSSGLGISVLKGFGPYGAAKAGLVALTKSLAAEHAPSIRANAVAPSAILTGFMGGGTGRGGDDLGTWDWFGEKTPAYLPLIPLGRLAVPDDVVGPVLFLMSEAARFMTGQTLHVNGGRVTP
jgi:NAD(P)-dependent dehydrogenase (short-subunit alcohol dehydrogenase family)